MDLRILLISVILLSFFDFCVQDRSNGNNANNNSQNNNNNNYNDNTNNNCSNAKNDKSNNGNKNNNNNNNGNNNNGNQNNNNNNNGNSNCSNSDNNDDGNNSNSTTTNDDDSDNSSDNTDVDTTIRAKENTASDDDIDDTSVTKPTPNNNNTSASVSTKSAATSPVTTKPTATVSNLESPSTEHTDDLTSAKNVTKPTIHSVTPPLSIENTSGLMPANNVTEATTLSSLPPTTVEHTVGLTSANNVTEATTLSNLSPTTAEHTVGLTSANNVTEATTLSNLSPTSTDHTVGPALVTNATERDKQSMSRKTNRGPTDTGTEARTGQPYMTHEPGQVVPSIRLNGITKSYVGGYGSIFGIISVSDPNKVTVFWYRGNTPILQTPNSRFTMDKSVTQDQGIRTNCSLYIENITRRDAGDYSFRAQEQGQEIFIQSTQFPFQVIDYPEISIRPLTLTVSKGGSRANFTCRISITNEKDLEKTSDNPSFVWMVNNKTVSANQSEFVVSKISNVEEQMEFEPDSENGFVTCSFINATATAQYHVLNNTEVKSCPEETDQNGIRWTSVLAGSTVLADCPMYQSGEASRRCGYNGLWAESANLIDCVSLDLIQLEWKVDDKIDGVVEDGVTFGTLLEELRNVTWEEIQRSNRNLLGAGNLDKTVDLLEKISDHQNNTTEEEVQVFADIVDSVLGLEEDEEWERITTRSRSKPAVILESVQRTGASAGKQLPTNASLSINRTNIELYISKMAAVQTLVFPSGSNEKNSYFVLSEKSLPAISDAQTKSPADDMSVVMTATRYTTITSFMPATLENNNGNLAGISLYFVNTEVLSLSFGDGQVPINLPDPIVLYFKHINVNASDPICSFWNFDSKIPGGAWSGDGCVFDASLSNLTQTVCRCCHLTNFAVLMSVSPYTPSPKDEAVLEVITLVGCSLSIIGCLLTIAVYIRLWRYVKSARYHLLLQLCSSLVIVYTIFLAGINKTDNEALCTAVALLLHFFLLVAFFLMLAMGIEIAINVTYVFATRSKLIYLVLIGWAVPFVIVVIAASVTGLEGYGGRSCWLSVDNGLIYAFVGPAILVIIANSVILWVVLRAVYSTSIMITKNTLEKAKTGARSMCVLMPVMGITWVFGMLTVNEWLVFFQYIFAICNCLQGVFIFVMYCLLNSSVREGIQRVRHKHKASNSYSSDDSKQRKSAVSKKTLLGFGTSFGNHSPEGSNSVNNKPSQLKSSNENIVDPTMDINLTPLPLGLENNAVQE